MAVRWWRFLPSGGGRHFFLHRHVYGQILCGGPDSLFEQTWKELVAGLRFTEGAEVSGSGCGLGLLSADEDDS